MTLRTNGKAYFQLPFTIHLSRIAKKIAINVKQMAYAIQIGFLERLNIPKLSAMKNGSTTRKLQEGLN